MQNWLVKTSHLSHFRVGMQGVAVGVESVVESLIGSCLFFFHHVCCTFWDRRELRFDCSFVPKATSASDKQTCPDNAL